MTKRSELCSKPFQFQLDPGSLDLFYFSGLDTRRYWAGRLVWFIRWSVLKTSRSYPVKDKSVLPFSFPSTTLGVMRVSVSIRSWWKPFQFLLDPSLCSIVCPSRLLTPSVMSREYIDSRNTYQTFSSSYSTHDCSSIYSSFEQGPSILSNCTWAPQQHKLVMYY